MSTIQRYELTLAEEQTLLLPQGARLLSVGDYNGTLALWALVNIEKPKR